MAGKLSLIFIALILIYALYGAWRIRKKENSRAQGEPLKENEHENISRETFFNASLSEQKDEAPYVELFSSEYSDQIEQAAAYLNKNGIRATFEFTPP